MKPTSEKLQLDRFVKIWYLFPTSKEMLTREDKPLFSSSRIHKARVLSVAWCEASCFQRTTHILITFHNIGATRLDHDILLTNSAPALLREKPDIEDAKETYLEAGTLTIWRWLGIDRFFPPGHDEEHRQEVLRGCASVGSLILSQPAKLTDYMTTP
jgi:polycomb protein EED